MALISQLAIISLIPANSELKDYNQLVGLLRREAFDGKGKITLIAQIHIHIKETIFVFKK